MFQRNARTPPQTFFRFALVRRTKLRNAVFHTAQRCTCPLRRHGPELSCIAAIPRHSAIATKSAKVAIKALRLRRTLFTYMRERIYNSAHSAACPWSYAPHPGQGCALGLTPCRRHQGVGVDHRSFLFHSILVCVVATSSHGPYRMQPDAASIGRFRFCVFLVSLTVCRRRIRLRRAWSLVSAGIPLIATWGHL